MLTQVGLSRFAGCPAEIFTGAMCGAKHIPRPHLVWPTHKFFAFVTAVQTACAYMIFPRPAAGAGASAGDGDVSCRTFHFQVVAVLAGLHTAEENPRAAASIANAIGVAGICAEYGDLSHIFGVGPYLTRPNNGLGQYYFTSFSIFSRTVTSSSGFLAICPRPL